MKADIPHIAIIGGGAGGTFGAIELARRLPNASIVLFEKSQQLLSKVRISGGGRCNATHAEFDPQRLASNYPRGSQFLRPLFHSFQPKNIIEWFEKEGISLVKEADGRMFPSTNSSETIICKFKELLGRHAVQIRLGTSIEQIESGACAASGASSKAFLTTQDNERLGPFDAVLIAAGSSPKTLNVLHNLGLELIPQVPSLFTFNCPSSPFSDLAGVSLDLAELSLPEIYTKGLPKSAQGPILITHWGFSGPAVLRLSAFYARRLYESSYRSLVHIDWAPKQDRQELQHEAELFRNGAQAKKLVKNCPLTASIPKSLFEKCTELAGIASTTTWSSISHKELDRLIAILKQTKVHIDGKTTYKNEFVTAGGVSLNEITPKTMASKKYPWLFFTGEILDIDGVTGGFNFQAAWTTAWTAAAGIAEFLR